MTASSSPPTPARGSVTLRGIAKRFGQTSVIDALDLAIEPGEFTVFVGPSGCGKSTLLRLIAGLETPTAGTIAISGRDVTAVHPSERGIAMVFQSYALYPHMTVSDNMGFGLSIRGMKKADIREGVGKAAAILQLEKLLERKPRELSGGQRQRVAIGRAIVREPDVFLFDEPLSNLDAALRGQMRVELARLHAQLGATMIYVTHDQVEAMTLAQRIVVLNGGRIEQVGAPMDLYRHPANRFVAGFLGSPRMNFIDARVVRAEAGALRIATATGERVLPIVGAPPADGVAITLGVRPEDLRVADDTATAADVVARGAVQLLERLGGETLAHVRVDGAADAVIVKLAGDAGLAIDRRVALVADAAACRLFATDGRAIEAPR